MREVDRVAQVLTGYHGRYLRIDLSRQTVVEVTIPTNVLRECIGGTGLGTWILLREKAWQFEALDPRATLAFVFSPLVGSPITTSAKFALLARSPLTGRLNDSLSSSSFAIAGKRTGFDAIVVTGQAESLSTVVVDDGQVSLLDAANLQGYSAAQTEGELKRRLGSEFRCAAIGRAGENLVPFATVSNESRHAGRGGLGAVMGSKNLKALAVSGRKRVAFHDSQQLHQLAKRLSEESFGPATEKYRELGTISNMLTFNRLGTLPTRNFQQTTFEAAGDLAGEPNPDGSQSDQVIRTRASCAACTIGCEHIFHIPDQAAGVRIEYENLFSLGSLCGITDPQVVWRASALCDELGLDTISAGATIAFAMECAERGLLDEPALRFGNGPLLLELLTQIADREGLGAELSQGSRRLAEQIGSGSESFAPHVKGLEIPGYEPRVLRTMALGFAVGTRGADHNRSGAYEADFSSRVDRLQAGTEVVPAAIASEDEAVLMDSLIMCKFLRGVFPDRMAGMAELLAPVTGWNGLPEDLTQCGKRLVDARKHFNILAGWDRSEDTLPKRFLDELVPDGVGQGSSLTAGWMAEMVQAYYEARGWTKEGLLNSEQQRVLDELLSTECPETAPRAIPPRGSIEPGDVKESP